HSPISLHDALPIYYIRLIYFYRQRYAHYGHGEPHQAIVGLGGQFFMRPNSQDAINEFRPYFDNAPVYGHGPTMEDFTEQTPLTVASPSRSSKKTGRSGNSSAYN